MTERSDQQPEVSAPRWRDRIHGEYLQPHNGYRWAAASDLNSLEAENARLRAVLVGTTNMVDEMWCALMNRLPEDADEIRADFPYTTILEARDALREDPSASTPGA